MTSTTTETSTSLAELKPGWNTPGKEVIYLDDLVVGNDDHIRTLLRYGLSRLRPEYEGDHRPKLKLCIGRVGDSDETTDDIFGEFSDYETIDITWPALLDLAGLIVGSIGHYARTEPELFKTQKLGAIVKLSSILSDVSLEVLGMADRD